jgi:hypothetical protein
MFTRMSQIPKLKKKTVFSNQLIILNQLIQFHLTIILILCEKEVHNRQIKINGIRNKIPMKWISKICNKTGGFSFIKKGKSKIR